MIILPFIPILALLIQTSFSLYDILQYRSEVNEIESQVNIIVADFLSSLIRASKGCGGKGWNFQDECFFQPSSKNLNQMTLKV